MAAEVEFINTTLRYQLRRLRARSRQAGQNNPFARRFFNMVVNNVAGPTPFALQAKVRFKNGKLDTSANSKIEDEWDLWGKKGVCEMSGRFSWNAVQRLLVRTLAVDGELLLRRYRGADFGRHGYQLQMIDVDRLDDLKNEALPGGGAIHMGVEVDAQSRPVAYHILKRKPASWATNPMLRESERILAEDILHLFIPESAEQVRGVPWIYAALLNLVHLGAFEEAAVIAARVGASQMGVIESPDGGKTLADSQVKDEASGNPQINVEPGTFQMLPPGYTVGDGWNPKYPDAAIEPFVKACLRGIAVGCDVAYHNLSGDMEGVNYSSARIAELDERDSWTTLQNFVAEHLHDDIYADWLRMAVLTRALPFDLDRIDNYKRIYWQPKRWAWVDPEKEVNASIKAIEARLKSRTRIISEQGEDIEDTFDEIAAEEQLAADKKVTLPVSPLATTGKPSTDVGGSDGGTAADGGGKARAAAAPTLVLGEGAFQVKAETTCRRRSSRRATCSSMSRCRYRRCASTCHPRRSRTTCAWKRRRRWKSRSRHPLRSARCQRACRNRRPSATATARSSASRRASATRESAEGGSIRPVRRGIEGDVGAARDDGVRYDEPAARDHGAGARHGALQDALPDHRAPRLARTSCWA
jgi:lambda family phage portal protein